MFRALLAIGIFGAITFAAVASEGGPKERSQYEIEVTPEMERHSRIRDTLYFTGVAWTIGALFVVLRTRLSARMRDASRRVARSPFAVTATYVLLLAGAMALLELPLTYYGDFHVPHEFGLTDQTLGAWVADGLKAFVVNALLGALLGALALSAVAQYRRWWIAVWIGSIPVMFTGAILWPVFIDPLFNRFEPLRDDALRARLAAIASTAGIPEERIYQVDKSKQTRTMNAYVTGIGPTNRIVMWDTLLQKLTQDEVVAVMGHEMGHYVLRHVWKGLAWGIAISLVVCLMAQQVYERGIARFGARWGVEGKGDPAAIPWMLIIIGTIAFLLAPVMNGISRRAERQADVYALETTGLNDALAGAFVKFATDSKVDPSPHPFIEFWRYSHPSLEKRIESVTRTRGEGRK